MQSNKQPLSRSSPLDDYPDEIIAAAVKFARETRRRHGMSNVIVKTAADREAIEFIRLRGRIRLVSLMGGVALLSSLNRRAV